MQVIKRKAEMRQASTGWLRDGKSIGFVPTMGALHAGHGILIKTARQENERVVVSVFVNPVQFGPQEDYARYPRTLEADLELAAAWGADVVFAPEVSEMYPAPPSVGITLPQALVGRLCGAGRPGHFQGVALVVAKLLNIVRPSRSYFGQKDYQQTRVIRSVVRELDLPGDVVICPTVREPDGLAMSSRNRYLSGPERQQALALRRALLAAEAMLAAGERAAEKVSEAMRAILASAPDLAVEYAQVCDAGTLQELTVLQDRVLLAVAARIGGTRLIDNSLVPLGRAPLGHTRLSGEKEF